MRDLLQRPDLFSINTATLGYKTPLPAIIDACAARGIGAIAPWRRELQGEDLQQIAHQLAASNMSVSGLCRSTYYTAPTLAERKLAIDDNRRGWTTQRCLTPPVICRWLAVCQRAQKICTKRGNK